MLSEKPEKLLHETFLVGVALKGVNAVLEIIAAVSLYLLTTNKIIQAVSALTAKELLEDPQDKIANFLLHHTPYLSADARLFILVYLLSHGLIKIGLVVALFKRYLWAFPLSMAVFGAFAVYQLYRYAHTHSLWLLVLTVFDAAIILLAWHEYRHLRKKDLPRLI